MKASNVHDRCPACGRELDADPHAALSCKSCNWHLVTRAEWEALSPFQQGFTLYMQSAWPTSELRGEKNPYAANTPAWSAFQEGGHRAMLCTTDGEE